LRASADKNNEFGALQGLIEIGDGGNCWRWTAAIFSFSPDPAVYFLPGSGLGFGLTWEWSVL
jgi:hypothetical protein